MGRKRNLLVFFLVFADRLIVDEMDMDEDDEDEITYPCPYCFAEFEFLQLCHHLEDEHYDDDTAETVSFSL